MQRGLEGHGDTGPTENTLPAAFPNEVFEAIFDHLSPLELARLAQASRSLYAVSTSSTLWMRAYLSFWREEDEEKGTVRATREYRQRQRFSELRDVAKKAWGQSSAVARLSAGGSKRRRTGTAASDSTSTATPFPLYLGGDERAHPADVTPHFYRLFLERIRIDSEVLAAVEAQCCSSAGWMERVRRVVEAHGTDAKDVLHALVASQLRKEDDGGDDGHTLDHASALSLSSVFPTALQVRLPTTKRSRTHHLSLLHFGRELLEHLQCREALQGLVSLRAGSNISPLSSHWTAVCSVGREDGEEGQLQAARRAKGVETAISWLAMFRGGEGLEVAEELDVLAVACALYLASHGISLAQDAQQFATGIYRFMLSRSFKGATPTEYKNLDNNFLHFCLDESGRETLPMSLVVIFCAIASRLGLPALPTNTPARIIAVVEWPPAPLPSPHAGTSPSPNRFWIDVYGDGQILSADDVGAMLARMRYPMDETFVAPSTPVATCLRASRNIVMSVQGAQSTPRFRAPPVGTLDGEQEDAAAMHMEEDDTKPADEVFESIMRAPSALFNPRRTYLGRPGPQLVSPFWPTRVRSRARYQRASKWCDYDQQAAMHAASNALTRLSDELGDRGSDWCATLIQTYFPLDTLVTQGEFVDQAQQSPLYVQNDATRRSLSTMFQNLVRQDHEGPSSMRRTSTQHDHIHHIGTLFVHRAYGYKAAVVGWNDTCNATEEWMLSMGVDSLPGGGRQQPFYQSLVDDGSTRYVAHCNVVPATYDEEQRSNEARQGNRRLGSVSLAEAEEVLGQRGIGKFFRCLALDGQQWRLVKNEQGQQAFPDD